MSAGSKKVALIAGVAGINGRNLVLRLEKLPDWTVIGVSRRPPDYKSRQTHVCVDLLNRQEVETKLKEFTQITHVFFAAYQEKSVLSEQVPPNLGMLRNLMEVVEKVPELV
jgi:nucleoside-diphosphate-sugar epimerase